MAFISTSGAYLSKMWLEASCSIIEMNQRIAIFFLLIVIGCATPVGKLKKSDFAWEERVISANYQEVYRRILSGFRKCGEVIPEGNLYTDIQEGRFDVYVRQTFGGRSDFVFGIIDVIYRNENATLVRVGVQTIYDGVSSFGTKGRTRKLWLKWAEGIIDCRR